MNRKRTTVPRIINAPYKVINHEESKTMPASVNHNTKQEPESLHPLAKKLKITAIPSHDPETGMLLTRKMRVKILDGIKQKITELADAQKQRGRPMKYPWMDIEVGEAFWLGKKTAVTVPKKVQLESRRRFNIVKYPDGLEVRRVA